MAKAEKHLHVTLKSNINHYGKGLPLPVVLELLILLVEAQHLIVRANMTIGKEIKLENVKH